VSSPFYKRCTFLVNYFHQPIDNCEGEMINSCIVIGWSSTISNKFHKIEIKHGSVQHKNNLMRLTQRSSI